jgi:hypothetical protein
VAALLLLWLAMCGCTSPSPSPSTAPSTTTQPVPRCFIVLFHEHRHASEHIAALELHLQAPRSTWSLVVREARASQQEQIPTDFLVIRFSTEVSNSSAIVSSLKSVESIKGVVPENRFSVASQSSSEQHTSRRRYVDAKNTSSLYPFNCRVDEVFGLSQFVQLGVLLSHAL